MIEAEIDNESIPSSRFSRADGRPSHQRQQFEEIEIAEDEDDMNESDFGTNAGSNYQEIKLDIETENHQQNNSSSTSSNSKSAKKKQTLKRNDTEDLADQEPVRPVKRLNSTLVTIDEAYDELGGMGKYQKCVCWLVALSFICGGLVLFNIAFFELHPKYKCMVGYGMELEELWEECVPEQFCPNLNSTLTEEV